jgi:sec-independent protein translocase protein TatB
MFDIGWQEIFLIAVIALIVIGPKDLPRTLKTVTGALRKVKGMARDFQSGLDDIVRETELDDMRRQIEAETGGDIRKSIEDSIDPEGEISKDINDMRDIEGDLSKAAQGYGDDVNKIGSPDKDKAASSSPPPPPSPPAETAKTPVETDNNTDKKSGEG